MPDRYHALDSLRGFAMFLGIALHAAISFVVTPFPMWPVRDRDPSMLADVFLVAVHDFRMQLFFLLAGFFACLLYQRYGLLGLVRNRVKRVLIPLLLAVIFIVPTVMMVFLYAEVANYREQGPPEKPTEARQFAVDVAIAHPEESAGMIVVNLFTSPQILERVPPPAHLWFLYYLLIHYTAVVVLAPLLVRLGGTRLLARIDAAFRRMLLGRGRVLVPALFTFPLLFTMTSWIVDTPSGWRPLWQVIGYYFLFFSFGWMLFRHRDLIDTFGRGWRLNLVLANLVLLPGMIGLTIAGLNAEKSAYASLVLWKVGAFALQSLYTWLMIVGLWGAFLHYFGRGSARARYLADASYWCYLASITPIVLLQFWVADWPLPGVVKFAFITTLTMAFLLASYEWCVRYTLIGAILNGRKVRHRLAPVTHPVPITSVT